MPKPEPDPRSEVTITRVTKRGEWHTVEGHVKGRGKVSVEIPAPSLDSRDRQSAEALMRRSLYGESRRERDPRDAA